MIIRQIPYWAAGIVGAACLSAAAAPVKAGRLELLSAETLPSRQQDISGKPAQPFVVAEAEEHGKGREKEAPNEAVPVTTPVEQTPGEQYCSNVFDAAASARLAQQKAALSEAQKQIDVKIAALAKKTDELKAWIKKRDDFTALAQESLVQIYSKMKSDAAASQLTAMDELTAAAVVSKLPPKTTSLILAEMEAAKAARLSSIISVAGELALKPERKADAQ